MTARRLAAQWKKSHLLAVATIMLLLLVAGAMAQQIHAQTQPINPPAELVGAPLQARRWRVESVMFAGLQQPLEIYAPAWVEFTYKRVTVDVEGCETGYYPITEWWERGSFRMMAGYGGRDSCPMAMVRSLILNGVWASNRYAVSGSELRLTGEGFGAEVVLVLDAP